MIPGDGIGPEISQSVKDIFAAAGVSPSLHYSIFRGVHTLPFSNTHRSKYMVGQSQERPVSVYEIS